MIAATPNQFKDRQHGDARGSAENVSPLGDHSLMLAYLKVLRPRHVSKNAFCFLGVLFSGRFTSLDSDLAALQTFVMFCACASAIYIFNDIRDRKHDCLHERKRLRPIASGVVSVGAATLMGIVIVLLGLLVGYGLSAAVFVCVALYLLNNLFYSLGLKRIPLLDVLSIAFGFVLRLLAGIYAVDEQPTMWITLCTFFLASFLAIAKRRSELAALPQQNEWTQRPVLSGYTLPLLDAMVNGSGTMTVICYALFAALSHKNPTLVITVPIVFFGVMHYQRMVMLGKFGEEPERILTRDLPLQLTILLWLIAYFVIVLGKVQMFREA